MFNGGGEGGWIGIDALTGVKFLIFGVADSEGGNGGVAFGEFFGHSVDGEAFAGFFVFAVDEGDAAWGAGAVEVDEAAEDAFGAVVAGGAVYDRGNAAGEGAEGDKAEAGGEVFVLIDFDNGLGGRLNHSQNQEDGQDNEGWFHLYKFRRITSLKTTIYK